MSVQIETVHTDSSSMDYFHFGQGEQVLVILPGLSVQSVMGAADAIAAAYQSLEDSFTIYVFDRRRNIPPYYPVREMARDTAEAFRILGLQNVCVFGASQGGMIALVMAIEHPELIRKMALGSTSAHIQEPQFRILERWAELARKKDRVGLYLEFGKEIYPPEVYEQYRETLISAAQTATDIDLERFIIFVEGTRDFNVVDELDKISCPVMAVGVYEDRVLDSDATMEIAEKLEDHTDLKLYMYVGYGHAAFDTAPDYRERLLRFFTS